jgi:anti-repressor protein
MTTELSPFVNDRFGQIRIYIDDSGDPWFCAADVCRALEIANSRDAISNLDDDEKDVVIADTPGGPQKMIFVSEAGLYTLTLHSRKPAAKEFKRWITHDVIPSIRKHGGYLTEAKIEEVLTDPDTIIRLATDLKVARAEKAQLMAKVEADEPKVNFATAVMASEGDMEIGTFANILASHGYETGQNRFFKYLRDTGWLKKEGGPGSPYYNQPKQPSAIKGLFATKLTAVKDGEGKPNRHFGVTETVPQTLITPKGQEYFINLLLGPIFKAQEALKAKKLLELPKPSQASDSLFKGLF